MPNATVRAKARTISKTAPHPDANLIPLRRSPPSLKPPSKRSALSFMAPAPTRKQTPRPRALMRSRGRSFALPTTDTEMMRLKARIYLWSEATDFKTFAAKNEGDGPSEAVLVSLFRDLGADRAPVDPVFAAIARHSVARDALIEAFPRTDTVMAKREGREVTKADEEAVEALNLGEEAAFLDLLVIVPTTLEGRRALPQHLVQRDEDGIYEPIGALAAKMLRLPMFAQGRRAHERRKQRGHASPPRSGGP